MAEVLEMQEQFPVNETVGKVIVTPAKAGVQTTRINKIKEFWMPATGSSPAQASPA